VSIKEKAAEIKGYATVAFGKGGKADGMLSIVIMVLVASAAFFLGRMSSSEHSALPEPVPMTVEADVAPKAETSNETTAHASTTVGDTTKGSEGSEASGSSTLEPGTEAQGVYVGSRKGTKYHLPWCAGARTISEANKVWFTSKEDAVAQGYTPAQNCKGI
jgi:hypothetical protein